MTIETTDIAPVLIKREMLECHINHGFDDAAELLDFIEGYRRFVKSCGRG